MGLKLLSLLIAIILWFVVLGSRNVEVTKEMPIEVITPTDLVVSNDVPDKIAFRLSGPKAFLRNIVNRKEKTLRVDLSNAKAGLVTYRFYSDNIQVPIGVKVVSINPTAVLIKLETLKKKEVPVTLLTKGEVSAGYRLARLSLVRNSVRLRGAESRIDQLVEVPTQPIDLSQLISSGEREISIDLSRYPGILVDGDLPQIRFDVLHITTHFKIRNVAVRVLTSRRFSLSPQEVTLYIQTTADQVKLLDRTKVYAYVDLKEKGAGTYDPQLSVQLPSNIKLIKVLPSTVRVVLH